MRGDELRIVELATKSVVTSWTAPPISTWPILNWSPNGRELSITGHGLWIYNLDTKTASKVLSGQIGWSSWSRPDMSRFAFQRMYGPLHRDIWVADLDPNVSTTESLGPGRTAEEHCQEMVDYYTRQIDTGSEDPAHYLSRAECYLYLQNREKAFADLEQCAKLLRSRDHPAAAFLTKLAVLCEEQTRYDEVESEFVNVLAFSSSILGQEDPLMLNQLAWFQATFPVAEFRNGTNAIKYATKACELTDWKNVIFVDTLAASYAEAGDFDSAVKWQKEAIDLLTEEQPSWLRAEFQTRLKLYQSSKPYRENP